MTFGVNVFIDQLIIILISLVLTSIFSPRTCALKEICLVIYFYI